MSSALLCRRDPKPIARDLVWTANSMVNQTDFSGLIAISDLGSSSSAFSDLTILGIYDGARICFVYEIGRGTVLLHMVFFGGLIIVWWSGLIF